MRRKAFTLIELLVVVAIIGLLISILLPNLACARDQARAAKCGVQLRSFGLGLNMYASEHNDWIVGRNTTGTTFNLKLREAGDQRDVLKDPRNPTQDWDWMSPLIAYDTALSGDRPTRYRTLVGEYGCPTQLGRLKAFIYPDGLNKSADKGLWNSDNKQFGDYTPNSYMASGPMQSFGKSVSWGSGSRTTRAFAPSSGWNVQYPNYEPRLDRVGQASEKVFATDGTRYLDQQKLLDFDPQPSEALYGSFADGGAWYSRSGAFGVRPGSKTWDDEVVPADGAAAAGEQLELSYRHGCLRELGVEVRTNKGTMNAIFHDGHVERLNDRQSREVALWYPKGSIHKKGSDIGLTKLPNGFEVP